MFDLTRVLLLFRIMKKSNRSGINWSVARATNRKMVEVKQTTQSQSAGQEQQVQPYQVLFFRILGARYRRQSRPQRACLSFFFSFPVSFASTHNNAPKIEFDRWFGGSEKRVRSGIGKAVGLC